jgi:hypothetical protein
MMLLDLLKNKAVSKGLLSADAVIDAEIAFSLVRDMPYGRASSRKPETIIDEWKGTCSGKHYLLKGLFTELGYEARVIACTTVEYMDPKEYWGKLRKLLKQSNGELVDVHNYLILDLPDGEMIVDATWPASTRGMGTVINHHFVLGENQQIDADPIQTWVVPDDQDAQEFKAEILRKSFSPEQLAHREQVVETISKLSNNRLIKLLLWLEQKVKGRSGR